MRRKRQLTSWQTPISGATRVTSIAVEDDHYLTITLTAEQSSSQELSIVTFPYCAKYAVSRRPLSKRKLSEVRNFGWTQIFLTDEWTTPLAVDPDVQHLLNKLYEAAGVLKYYRILSDDAVIDIQSESVPEFKRVSCCSAFNAQCKA